jgi:hypothetical protein
VHVHTSSCCAVPLLVQCRLCEYAGCIWIVVVIVVPIVTAIADSSNIEKTMIVFIFQMYGYEIFYSVACSKPSIHLQMVMDDY